MTLSAVLRMVTISSTISRVDIGIAADVDEGANGKEDAKGCCMPELSDRTEAELKESSRSKSWWDVKLACG